MDGIVAFAPTIAQKLSDIDEIRKQNSNLQEEVDAILTKAEASHLDSTTKSELESAASAKLREINTNLSKIGDIFKDIYKQSEQAKSLQRRSA